MSREDVDSRRGLVSRREIIITAQDAWNSSIPSRNRLREAKYIVCERKNPDISVTFCLRKGLEKRDQFLELEFLITWTRTQFRPIYVKSRSLTDSFEYTFRQLSTAGLHDMVSRSCSWSFKLQKIWCRTQSVKIALSLSVIQSFLKVVKYVLHSFSYERLNESSSWGAKSVIFVFLTSFRPRKQIEDINMHWHGLFFLTIWWQFFVNIICEKSLIRDILANNRTKSLLFQFTLVFWHQFSTTNFPHVERDDDNLNRLLRQVDKSIVIVVRCTQNRRIRTCKWLSLLINNNLWLTWNISHSKDHDTSSKTI